MSAAPVTIRQISAADAEPLRAIYNDYVEFTPITFDIEPRSRA